MSLINSQVLDVRPAIYATAFRREGFEPSYPAKGSKSGLFLSPAREQHGPRLSTGALPLSHVPMLEGTTRIELVSPVHRPR